MSRSRRHTPKMGITTAESEKEDKRRWHKAFRRASRMAKNAGEFISSRLFDNAWTRSKDGKRYWGKQISDKDMRK